MSLFTLWLYFTVLPNLGVALLLLSVFSLLVATVAAIVSEAEGRPYSYAKKALVVSAVALFLAVPMPSQKDMAIILGGYAATNSEEMAKLPDNVLKAANAYLEKITKENTDKE